jgi:WD40 repeat protein
MTSPRRFVWPIAVFLGGAALTLPGGAAQQEPKNPPGIRQVVFSPDGKWLAAAAGEPEEQGEATVWDVSARRALFTHRESRGIPTVAFSPDKKLLAVGVFSENARLLDPTTGKVLATLAGHGEAARGACFSPDGKTLAIGCYDGGIRLWDPAGRTLKNTLKGHTNWVYCVRYSPDGKWLASSSSDNTVRLWDAKAGRLREVYKGYGSILRAVDFSPDNRWLAAPCWDGSAKVREVPSGKVLADFRGGSADGIAFSPAGLLAVSGFSRGIQLFELSLEPPGPEVYRRIKALIVKLDDESYAAREEATKELAELGAVAEPELRKAMKESPSVEVRIRARRLRKNLRSPPPLAVLRGHRDEVETVAFSPNGNLLASGGKDGLVKLWDVKTRTELATFTNRPE